MRWFKLSDVIWCWYLIVQSLTVLLLPQLADELFSACAGLQRCCQVILFCFGARFFCRQCTLASHICFQGFTEKVTCLAIVKTNMNGQIEQPVKVLPTLSKLQYMRTGSFSGLVQANGILCCEQN